MIVRLTLLLCFTLYSGLLAAQHSRYDIINYTTDNGLPQNGITGIQFDRKGYCWLGTQMGLVRFDGQRFTLFGSDNIAGIRSDRILNLTRDTAGTLFVSTGGIIHVLKIKDSLSVSAPVPVLLSGPQPEVPIRGFVVPDMHAGLTFKLPFQTTLGTATGNKYLVYYGQGYYITPAGKTLFSIKEDYQEYRLLLINESLVFLQGHKNVGLWTRGIQQPQPELQGPLWSNPDFIKGNFTTPYNTENAYVYAGNTLYRLLLAHDTLYSEVILDGIDIPSVSCVYIDQPNNKFYIGSAVSGLFIIRRSDFYTPPTPDMAINLGFYSQAVTEEGILSQHFLFRKDGSRKEYPIIRHSKASWYNRENRSLYYAPDLALLRFNLETEKTQRVAPLSSRLSSLFPDPGQTGLLLFSTSFSIGKIRRDTLVEEKVIQGLKKGQELFAAYPAGTDTFLLATWSGVKWYDYKNNRIYRSILDSFTVRQLYAESLQRIWIATYGKGWFLYDKGRLFRLPDGPRDALKTVNAIIDDGRGCFWLSSNNGLYKAGRQALLNYAEGRSETVYFYAFTTQDQLPTNEFNSGNPPYVWMPDSMLSLPSIKGLVWFYPHRLRLTLPDKGIFIERIWLDEREIELAAPVLTLEADHGRLSIAVSSPYFGNKENLQLQFRVEGLDEDWHALPGNGEIVIGRLPAGSYTIQVRKMNEHHTRLVLPVKVRPYWYDTWPFYLALFLLTALFVYWLIRLRTRVLQLRNRKLKTQVSMQTRDLNRAVRQLTRSEEELKESNRAKDNIITTVLHDLRSPVRFLYTISKHVAGRHRTMAPEALHTHLEELKNSTASLNSFTDQFFTWAISQHRSFAAKYATENLDGIFTDAASLYTDIMGANGNRLVVDATGLYCYTDAQLLSTIIRNLLDNANKNTRNGTIRLAATTAGRDVLITISDTGKGFTPEALRAFLDKDKAGSGGGKGSFIVLYLLGLIGGQLDAVSSPGRGTEFRITLSHQHSDPHNKPGG